MTLVDVLQIEINAINSVITVRFSEIKDLQDRVKSRQKIIDRKLKEMDDKK